MERGNVSKGDDKMVIEIRNMFAGYKGGPDILKGIYMNFYEHEIACIIGPNGAGKSTLLKAIFNIEVEIRKGSIIFCGENIINCKSVELLRKGILFVPQGHSIFPLMTVRENLEMGAFIREDKKLEEDIEWILDKFPVLKEKQNKMAGNLSGGQQKILEFGRTLLLHPVIILLDEPSLGLAPQMRNTLAKEIVRFKEDFSVVLVEQNAKMALEISDHAIVLDLGKKRFEGTGEEIISNKKVKKLYLGTS